MKTLIIALSLISSFTFAQAKSDLQVSCEVQKKMASLDDDTLYTLIGGGIGRCVLREYAGNNVVSGYGFSANGNKNHPSVIFDGDEKAKFLKNVRIFLENCNCSKLL